MLDLQFCHPDDEPELYANLVMARRKILDYDEFWDEPLVMQNSLFLGCGAWMRGYGAGGEPLKFDREPLKGTDSLVSFSCHPDTWAAFPPDTRAKYEPKDDRGEYQFVDGEFKLVPRTP